MCYYEIGISAWYSLQQCFSYRDESLTIKRFSVSRRLRAGSAIQLPTNYCLQHLCSQLTMLKVKPISAYIRNSCVLKFLFISLVVYLFTYLFIYLFI
jgi:hypothetical protein